MLRVDVYPELDVYAEIVVYAVLSWLVFDLYIDMVAQPQPVELLKHARHCCFNLNVKSQIIFQFQKRTLVDDYG
jgi:hypothetical protein